MASAYAKLASFETLFDNSLPETAEERPLYQMARRIAYAAMLTRATLLMAITTAAAVDAAFAESESDEGSAP